jgi:hypothetical protein
MSRWHREHPEYEEMGWEPPDFRAAWDLERKRQKEEGPIKQVSPDRAVITDDDRELCRACGELPATRGMYCRRCDDSIRDEREMRDA